MSINYECSMRKFQAGKGVISKIIKRMPKTMKNYLMKKMRRIAMINRLFSKMMNKILPIKR